MESIPLPSTALDVSCHSSEEARNMGYAQIERDIATLTQSILALKTRHNSLSLTARLPDEVLARVFTWNLSMQRKNFQVPWINLSFVCTSWRRIALNSPHLWSLIHHSLGTDQMTRILLPRSGDVPLHIKLTIFQRKRWEGLPRALDEIRRIWKLDLEIHEDVPVRLELLLPNFNQAAPLLESFKAHVNGQGDIYHFPDNLFDNTAPRLRTLKLNKCIISSTAPFISRLTKIQLMNLSSTRDPLTYLTNFSLNRGLSFSELLNVLDQASNVEHLDLTRTCDCNELTESPLSFRRVVLPHLIHLAITDHNVGCALLLSTLALPVATELSIQSSGNFELDIVDVLKDKITSRFETVHNLTITKDWEQYSLSLEGERGAVDEHSRTLKLSLVLKETSSEMLQRFLDALPLVHLRFLCVSATLPAEFWLNTLGTLPMLKIIHIEEDAPEFVKALISGISQEEIRASMRIGEDEVIRGVPSDRNTSDCQERQFSLTGSDADESAKEDERLDDQCQGSQEGEETNILSGVEEKLANNEEGAKSGGPVVQIQAEKGEKDQARRISALLDELEAEEREMRRVSSSFTSGRTSPVDHDAVSHLDLVPGPLLFTSLEVLKIRQWTSRSYRLDTTLLAAALHVRSVRGSTLRELSVENSTHYILNADRDVAKMREIVESVLWDITDGLAQQEQPEEGDYHGMFENRRNLDAYSSDFDSSDEDIYYY